MEVLRTDAGSDTWRTVASFPRSGVIQEAALALAAASAWLAGQSGLYVSADGVHWATVSGLCASTATASVKAAWLTSTTDGILVCGGQGAAGSQDKAVYGSSTGGRSFSLLGVAPRGGDLEAVSANQRDTVVVAAASGASALYASFDRGRTYSTVLALDDGGVGWRDLGFTTDEQGVAVESIGAPGRLFITRDGGHRWQVVRFTAG